MDPDEQILCIPKSVWDDEVGDLQDSFLPGHRWFVDYFRPEDMQDQLVSPLKAAGQWKLRGEVEHNPDWLQLIPYCVLEHAGQYALYRRAEASGEKRLTGKVSIGVGGHVRKSDFGQDVLAVRGIEGFLDTESEREIQEEFKVGLLANRIHLGWIYAPSTPVGRVHVGMVSIYEVAGGLLEPNSDEISEAWWADAQRLRGGDYRVMAQQMEDWSQIVLGHVGEAFGR